MEGRGSGSLKGRGMEAVGERGCVVRDVKDDEEETRKKKKRKEKKKRERKTKWQQVCKPILLKERLDGFVSEG